MLFRVKKEFLVDERKHIQATRIYGIGAQAKTFVVVGGLHPARILQFGRRIRVASVHQMHSLAQRHLLNLLHSGKNHLMGILQPTPVAGGKIHLPSSTRPNEAVVHHRESEAPVEVLANHSALHLASQQLHAQLRLSLGKHQQRRQRQLAEVHQRKVGTVDCFHSHII